MSEHGADHPYPEWSSSIDPAPGDLRIVQAFVNTLDVETGADDVSTPEDLARWLVEWSLLEDPGAIDDFEWRQAVTMREGLRALLLSQGDDGRTSSRLDALDHILRALPLRVHLDSSGSFQLVALSTGWPEAGARLLTLVIRAMSDGSWSRLKACRRPDCHWVFYDSSKNRSGKWCSMRSCGNLMKARAYRARQRGDRAGG